MNPLNYFSEVIFIKIYPNASFSVFSPKHSSNLTSQKAIYFLSQIFNFNTKSNNLSQNINCSFHYSENRDFLIYLFKGHFLIKLLHWKR